MILPRIPPPGDCPGTPLVQVVPAGSTLWRVHSDRFNGGALNPTPQPAPAAGSPVTGGRFDSLDGSYAYLYASENERGAFAESFARDLDYTRSGARPLPYALVHGKNISSVNVLRDIDVVVAYGAGAQQLGQDTWLTTCDEDDYPLCRQWAAAVRLWAPAADGLVWKSRSDPAEEVFVLWGDPASAESGCGLVDFMPTSTEPLGHGPARAVLDQWLLRWRLYIEPRRYSSP